MDFFEVDGYKNWTAAEAELVQNATIINADAVATNFPKTWSLNSLKRHLEIARLVNKFTELYADYKVCKSTTAKYMIEEEMDKIRDTLLHKYFVVTKDELVPDTETRHRYEEREKKNNKKK